MRSPGTTIAALTLLSTGLLAQATWTPLMPANAPSIRTEVGMASDFTGALMFGGLHGPSQVAYNELWRFDGTNWTLLAPTGTLPSARSRLAMAYDPVRAELVVFGGDAQYVGGGALGDTWVYDAANNQWSNPTPPSAPSARIHARMAYDLGTGKMIMYGGRSGGLVAETWEWDGNTSTWTQLFPTNSPAPLEQVNLAYNSRTGEIVLYGGSTTAGGTGGLIGETWIWDGSNWRLVPTATTPGGTGIRNGEMTYDAVRDRIVLFGGFRPPPAGSTSPFSDSIWEFDGTDWVERTLGTRPTGRAGMGFAFVQTRGVSYMCAGYDGGFYNDTWSYQTNALPGVSSFGTGCPVSTGDPTLALTSLAWTGDTAQFTVGNVPAGGVPALILGLSNTNSNLGALPANLAGFGYPNCNLLVSPDATILALAPVAVPILDVPSLIGYRVYGQAAVLEAAGGFLNLGMSQGIDVLIGAR